MKSLKSVNISISTTTRWIITIVVLAVALAVVIFLYTQEQTRNSDLKDELDTKQNSMVSNSLQRDLLEARLAKANLALYQLRAGFASSDDSIAIEEALYKAAIDAGVDISAISCPAPKAVTVGQQSYQVYTVTIGVQGNVESLLRFTSTLGHWLPSVGVKTVTINTNAEGPADLSLVLEVYGIGN